MCENETKFFFEYLYNRVFIKELCDKDNVLIECYNPKIRKNKTLKINFKKSIHHFSKKFIILLKKFIEYKNSIYALYQVRKKHYFYINTYTDENFCNIKYRLKMYLPTNCIKYKKNTKSLTSPRKTYILLRLYFVTNFVNCSIIINKISI